MFFCFVALLKSPYIEIMVEDELSGKKLTCNSSHLLRGTPGWNYAHCGAIGTKVSVKIPIEITAPMLLLPGNEPQIIRSFGLCELLLVGTKGTNYNSIIGLK